MLMRDLDTKEGRILFCKTFATYRGGSRGTANYCI